MTRMTEKVKVKIGVVVTDDGRFGVAVSERGEFDWSYAEDESQWCNEAKKYRSPKSMQRYIVNVELPLPTIPEVTATAELVGDSNP